SRRWVVEDGDGVSALEQEANEARSDEAGAAGDECRGRAEGDTGPWGGRVACGPAVGSPLPRNARRYLTRCRGVNTTPAHFVEARSRAFRDGARSRSGTVPPGGQLCTHRAEYAH